MALNIESKQQLLTVYADFKCRLGSRALVAPMITDPGVEMILGVVNDPQLGPLIVIGFGGVYAELLEDRVALLAPFSEAAAKQRYQNLKMKALLNGYRGQSAVNIDALCRAASLLSVIADELKETVLKLISTRFWLPRWLPRVGCFNASFITQAGYSRRLLWCIHKIYCSFLCRAD